MSQVAVVTGAAGAMGSACAGALVPAFDRIVLTDRDATGLRAVADRLADGGHDGVSVVVGDVGDAGFAAALADSAAARGSVRALVHTAGVSPSMTTWRDILRIDLTGSERLLDAFAGHVVPGTAAVCLASISGLMGPFDPAMDAVLDHPLDPDFAERFRSQFPGEPDPGSTYRLAKRGVIRSCERAAAVWGRHGGRVVSLSPGLIDTSMGRLELEHHPIKEEMARLTPVRSARLDPGAPLPGSVLDIAAAVAFLCSDAAGFISGCDLRVDGGLVGVLNHRRVDA
jgi:NAD(P)-dependent dehydrogenase (short-subunit alcohol dehydrogenase family)